MSTRPYTLYLRERHLQWLYLTKTGIISTTVLYLRERPLSDTISKKKWPVLYDLYNWKKDTNRLYISPCLCVDARDRKIDRYYTYRQCIWHRKRMTQVSNIRLLSVFFFFLFSDLSPPRWWSWFLVQRRSMPCSCKWTESRTPWHYWWWAWTERRPLVMQVCSVPLCTSPTASLSLFPTHSPSRPKPAEKNINALTHTYTL